MKKVSYIHRLSVGTDKGLIVLDVHTNNLIQVIGSEEKLLSKNLVLMSND